jgi:hypothetical protein
VAVVFQPQAEAVFPGGLVHAADVFGGDAVGDDAAQVPEETLALRGAADDAAAEHGQPGDGVVTELFLETFRQVVAPVLRTHLVAVGDDAGERPAVGGGHAFEELADERVEMLLGELAVHLVHFEAFAFRRGGRVGHAGGGLADALDDPLAGGHVPGEGAVFRELGG